MIAAAICIINIHSADCVEKNDTDLKRHTWYNPEVKHPDNRRGRYINFQPSDNWEQSVVDDVEYIRNYPLAASSIPIYGYILRCKNRQADRG